MRLLHLTARMKRRKHKLLMLCSLGICVLSLLFCYKSLQQSALLFSHQSTPLKILPVIGGYLWGDPFNAPLSHDAETYNQDVPDGGDLFLKKQFSIEEVLKGSDGELHKRSYLMVDDVTSYFIPTESGALCFQEGTDRTSLKSNQLEPKTNAANWERIPEGREKSNTRPSGMLGTKCICRQGWHGPNCGIPTVVQHSNLPTKSRLQPRKVPRRVINAININHEFDLLHARFHELSDAIDLFLVCESNFTAYGNSKPLTFLQQLLNGTFDYAKHKILYIFLDHFPEGGRSNGWIADDYLRTFLSRNGLSRVTGLRPDDVFLINDADEIPLREGILFLKLYDGWTEPVSLHLRKSLYGFYRKQPGTLEVLSACTMAMLVSVYRSDGILLRRRNYYSMPGFRRYENASGKALMPWSVGSPVHYAGWHCSWCFRPEGIYHKLVSAQNGDFPRWGDYEEKRKLSYIKELIRTGGWFDGSVPKYPTTDHKEHMFAPKYLQDNYQQYRYLLENPYTKVTKQFR